MFLDAASPYRPVKQYGLRNWLTAQVRSFLTRGAGYCVELDLERTIRFKAAELGAQAEFVLARRRDHRCRRLDANRLASVLGLLMLCPEPGFLQVWLRFIDEVADELVSTCKSGYIEDVSWAAAERYLDKAVAPRTRVLKKAGASPTSPVAPQAMEQPLTMLGGYRRFKRVLDGLTSADPEVVQQIEQNWRLLRFAVPSICDDVDWDGRMGLLSAAHRTAITGNI